MAQHKPCPYFRDQEKPFAQRTDGMSLDIIHPRDVPRGKIPFIKDEDRSLMTHDIGKAQPHYPHLNYLDKPDYSVGSTDPDHFGGRARTYYAPMDRRPRDLSLTTADIEYAQPLASKFKGNRHTDPVCPNYEMPSTHMRPITPPRWNGRHLHDISDIEKASSKIRIPDRNYVRDPNDSSDIEYASANYQERVQRRTRNGKPDITMNVQDINQIKPLHYAPRCLNPLEPVYKVSTSATTSLHTKFSEELGRSDVQLYNPEEQYHGEIAGSKPRKLQWDNGEPQFSLVREDIAGTVPQRWVGAVPCNIYDPPEVKEVISFHDPHDIPGAQVGSLKKGIEGSRRAGTTNPQNPRYIMLDGDARPQPVPVFDAERNLPVHSLYKSRAQAASLPNLAATPQASQRSMQRDASEGALLRRGPSGAPLGSPAASQRSGFGSRGGTPAAAAGRAYAQQPSLQPQRRLASGAGTPAYVPSGRGTPTGYGPPGRPGQTLPPAQARAAAAQAQYAVPNITGMSPQPDESYFPSPQNNGPPPQYGPGGSQLWMPEGAGQSKGYGMPGAGIYGDAMAGQQSSYGQSLGGQDAYGQSPGPGDYGDGYVPEGYVA